MNAFPTVNDASPLWGAALFALRIAAPGWAWSRALWGRAALAEEAPRSVLLGMIVALLSTLGLAAGGMLRPAPEWWLAGGLTVVGLVWASRREPAAVRPVGPALAVLLSVFALAAAAFLPARRGEWIAGGWDPGIYVNEGLVISRSGSLSHPPDPLYSRLSAEELALFTTVYKGQPEVMPGASVDPDTRSFQPLFFRLTPAFIALLDHCGGLRSALRASYAAGFLALFLFPFMLARLGAGRNAVAAGALLMLLQPLWIYHLRIPTSEMLQLWLLCGVGWFLPERHRPAGAAAIALLLLLAVVNRFSFLPFGALLVGALAWLDLETPQRRAVVGARLLQAAALAAGGWVDAATNTAAFARFQPVMAGLVGWPVALVAAALALDLAGRRPSWRERLRRLADAAVIPALAAGLAVLIGVAFLRNRPDFMFQTRWSSGVIWHFAGPAAVFGAVMGLPAILRREDAARPLRIWAAFLLAATAITVYRPEIMELQPWGARRFLEFTAPLLALLGGVATGAIVRIFREQPAWGQGAAVVFVTAIATGQSPIARHAARCSDFDGLSAQLAEVVARTAPGDVILCDHFRWSTPLRFIGGLRAVNGAPFCEERQPDRLERALAILQREAERDGGRLRILTSGRRGLDVFPGGLVAATPDWIAPRWTSRQVIHSARGREFACEEKTREFRLHTWAPPPAAVRPTPAAGP